MNMHSRKRWVVVASRFGRVMSLSLMLGTGLVLAAGPFTAKATSPVWPLVDTKDIVAQEQKTTRQMPVSEPQPQLTQRPTTARTANKPLSQSCTKAQPVQLPGLKLKSTGFVQQREPAEYYYVYGWSLDQVRAQLRTCAPDTYFAYTSSRLSWTYDFAFDDTGRCVIANVGVGVRTKIHYPAWKDVDQAPTRDQQSWRRMANSLVVHEAGHVQRSEAVGKRFYTALRSMPPTSCDTIAGKAQAIVAKHRQMMEHTHSDYDHQTNHGETQGAVL